MNDQQLQSELTTIRNLMEKSTKFISLSGASGILMGLYALIGTGIAHYFLNSIIDNPDMLRQSLLLTAILVLLAAVSTAYFLSKRKADQIGQSIRNAASLGLLRAMVTPLVSGGIVSLLLIEMQYYTIIVPILLIFYGLALHAGGNYTFRDIRGLSYIMLILGFLALLFPGYDLLFWSFGFGFLHILYGAIMYYKYERGRGA